MKRCAASLAQAIQELSLDSPVAEQVHLAYQKTLQRAPTPEELSKSTDYLTSFDNPKTGLARFAQVLLSLEEFRQIQ